MERCHLCKREAVLDLPYLKKWVCENCLLRMNYKRFRSQIRGVSNLNIKKEDTPSFYLMKYFLDKAKVKYKISPKGNIKSHTQDDLVEFFLKSVIENKSFKTNEVMPMSLIPDREIEVLNRSLKLCLKKKEKSFLIKNLDEIEKRRPGVQFSIRKIIKELQEL